MSRTKMEIRVGKVPLEAVRRAVYKWLEVRQFAILSMDSDGSPIVFGYLGARVRLHPEKGRLVCLHYKISGAIAFELDMRQDGDDVVVDCEGYAAGASLFSDREMELDPNVRMMGRWPRRKGHQLLRELENDIGSLSR